MDNIPVLIDYRLKEYFEELAADSLYPSAGSSAALTVAHAAALFTMACRINLRKARGNPSKRMENNGQGVFWAGVLQKAALLWQQSLALAQADGFAIKDFFEGMPGGAEKATDIPLEIACCAGEIIALLRRALPASYAPVQADLACASCLAEGGREAALSIARHNLSLLNRVKRQIYHDRIVALTGDAAVPAEDPPLF